MIGADKFFRATAVAIQQTRSAVATDIGKGTDYMIGAAYNDHAFADIVQAVPVTGFGNV